MRPTPALSATARAAALAFALASPPTGGEPAGLPAVQRQSGDGPADRSVPQRRHPVGDAGIDQRLSADDAAGPAGAVDDHQGIGRGGDLADAVDQFRTGHADAAGDRHGPVFLEPAGIQDDDVGLGIDQRLDRGCRQRRGVAAGFDQLAERLAGDVDVAVDLASRRLPAGQAAFQQRNVGVAEPAQPLGGGFRQTLAVVIDDDRDGEPGHQFQHLDLDAGRTGPIPRTADGRGRTGLPPARRAGRSPGLRSGPCGPGRSLWSRSLSYPFFDCRLRPLSRRATGWASPRSRSRR